MEKHQTYFNFLDALKEGCPVCSIVEKAMHKAMDDYLYESVNDPIIREEIKASRGFCNRHAWQLQKIGDGFGQAIIYEDLLSRGLEQFRLVNAMTSVQELAKRLSARKMAKAICLFCKQERDVEGRYLLIFWESFAEPEFKRAYNSSSGLCLPHLSQVLGECPKAGLGKELVDFESTKLNGLIVELREFIRKHDYRFSQEKFGKEGNSWIRAIEKLAGKEDVYQKGE